MCLKHGRNLKLYNWTYSWKRVILFWDWLTSIGLISHSLSHSLWPWSNNRTLSCCCLVVYGRPSLGCFAERTTVFSAIVDAAFCTSPSVQRTAFGEAIRRPSAASDFSWPLPRTIVIGKKKWMKKHQQVLVVHFFRVCAWQEIMCRKGRRRI